MKKIACCLFVVTAFVACNEQKSEPVVTETPVVKPVEKVPEAATTNPLIAKYDCETCHKTDEKMTGPSYQEIAQKYAGQSTAVNDLALKIINGGSGVWGSIPMNAHPAMPKGDAEEIVKYILALKK